MERDDGELAESVVPSPGKGGCQPAEGAAVLSAAKDDGELAESDVSTTAVDEKVHEHRSTVMAGALRAARAPVGQEPDAIDSADTAVRKRPRADDGGDERAAGDKSARGGSGDAPAAASAVRAAAADGDDARVGFPQRYPACGTHMHGWFLETHKRVFGQLLRADVKVILELGSWYGASTEWLARNAPEATVYAVDLWDEEFILKEQADHYHSRSNAHGREPPFVRMLREHPMYGSFLANLWPFRDRVVPLRMDTVAGVEHVKAKGVVPDLIYVDADHHYKAVLRDVRACLRAFPNAILVGDDYGNYKDVENAVLECAREFNKVVHVDQNHCWTYAPLQSDTGLTFRPKPKKGSSFASLLGSYGKS